MLSSCMRLRFRPLVFRLSVAACFALALAVSAADAAAMEEDDGGRPAVQLTLVDPGPIGAETTTNIYFPQVAVGGGYSTVFTLMNTGGTTTNGTLFLTDQSGNPFNVNLNEPGAGSAEGQGRLEATGSNFPIGPIAPGGTKFVTVTPLNAADASKSGWARVENIGGSLGGVATFQLTEGGILKTIAGVLASQPISVATIPVDDDQRVGFDRFTGYAIANTGTGSITVKGVVVTESGSVFTTFTIQLGPNAQTARFLNQDVPALTQQFKGSVVLIGQSGAQFAVVALVLNKGLFTAIPVIPEKAPAIQ